MKFLMKILRPKRSLGDGFAVYLKLKKVLYEKIESDVSQQNKDTHDVPDNVGGETRDQAGLLKRACFKDVNYDLINANIRDTTHFKL